MARRGLGEAPRRVVVAGTAKVDVVARAERFPRPGETLYGERIDLSPGGKGANQAVAAARNGVPVSFVGKTGTDTFGRLLRRFLEGERIGLRHLSRTRAAPTGITVVTVARAENTIVSVPGASGRLRVEDVRSVRFRTSDTFVTQCGIPAGTVKELLRRAKRAGARTVVNATPTSRASDGVLALSDVVVVNEEELVQLAKGEPQDLRSRERVRTLVDRIRPASQQTVVVTLGRRGLIVVEDTHIRFLGAHDVVPKDSTGAGDCLVGNLAAELSRGKPLFDALRYANWAAALSVQRSGAAPSMPRRTEVLRAMASART